MIPLSYKTNSITTNKANHRSVFANSGNTQIVEKKRISSNLFQNLKIVSGCSCFRISGHRSIPLRFSSLCRASRRPYGSGGAPLISNPRLRVHNSTSMTIYQNSVINYENYCKNSMKIQGNLLKSIQFQRKYIYSSILMMDFLGLSM